MNDDNNYGGLTPQHISDVANNAPSVATLNGATAPSTSLAACSLCTSTVPVEEMRTFDDGSALCLKRCADNHDAWVQMRSVWAAVTEKQRRLKGRMVEGRLLSDVWPSVVSQWVGDFAELDPDLELRELWVTNRIFDYTRSVLDASMSETRDNLNHYFTGEMADLKDNDLDPNDPAVITELRRQMVRAQAEKIARQVAVRREMSTIVWTTAQQRANRPAMVWLVDRLIPEVGAGVMFGPSYSGKSLLVLDLALSLANGYPSWMGFPICHVEPDAPSRRHVAMVLMEGVAGFPGRERAWLSQHPGASAHEMLTYEYQPVDLASDEFMDGFALSIAEATLDDGTPFTPSLVVVDTQGLAMPGEENSRSEVRAAYKLVKRLADTLRCFVLLLTHPGHEHPDRPAGASTQEQDSDVMIKIGVDGTLTVKKVKESVSGASRMFTVIPCGESAVAEQVEGAMAQLAQVALRSQTMTKDVLCAVRRLQGDGGVSKSEVQLAVGKRKVDFDSAVEHLLASGQLTNRSETKRKYLLWTDEEVDCSN